MSAPALIIRIGLEERPRAIVDVVNESEYRRLDDWIDSRDELQPLLRAALELLQQERAA